MKNNVVYARKSQRCFPNKKSLKKEKEVEKDNNDDTLSVIQECLSEAFCTGDTIATFSTR